MAGIRTLLSREESYAVHALIDVAANPGTNAAAIAERLSMPKAFTAKVLRRLVEHGFVQSQMGRKGGVWLDKPLTEISVLGVLEAMSGDFVMDTCQAEVLCATQRRKGFCRLNVAYHTVGSEIRLLLDGIRLHTLTGSARPEAPVPAGDGSDGG